MVAVNCNRIRAQPELSRDLAVGQTPRDEHEDFALACGEPLVIRFEARTVDRSAVQQAWTDVALALADQAHGGSQVRIQRVRDLNASTGARAQGGNHLGSVGPVVHADDAEVAGWAECGDRRGAAGFAIDRRADDERVDVVSGERLERVATVAGLGYDGDICIVFENPSKSTSDEGRALDQHHTESHTGEVSACVTFGVAGKLPAASAPEERTRRGAGSGVR